MQKLIFILSLFINMHAFSQNAEAIKGNWMSLPNEGLLINVYKDHGVYKGKVKWARDKEAAKPGFLIIEDLVYDAENNSWENGKIFDPKGDEYSASAKINEEGILVVRAYKGVKFLGIDKLFKRAK